MTILLAPLRSAPNPARVLFPPVQRRKASVPAAPAIAAYATFAVLAYWNVWTSPSSRLTGGFSDLAQSAWFLSWVPAAIVHHHGLFVTSAVDLPGGANLLVNTSMEFLGLIAAPVTLLFGPLLALNTLFTVAMAASASAAFFLVRRWVSWWPAAFAAGLAYGFSPYMAGEGVIHLHLVFAVFPPVVVMVLDEVLVVPWERSSWWQVPLRAGRWASLTVHPSWERSMRWGALLGVLAAAQFFISSEVLASSAVMALIGIGVLAWQNPQEVRRRWRHATAALGVAAGVAGVLLAYPVWVSFRGAGHLGDHIQTTPQAYSADLWGLIVPDRFQAIAPAAARHLSAHFVGGFTWEDGSYLGVTLIAVLVTGAVVLRSVPLMRFSWIMAAGAFVLSLGARLTLAGAPAAVPSGGVPLPEAALGHVPFLYSMLPVRFSLYVDLFAAIGLGCVLDRLRASQKLAIRVRWALRWVNRSSSHLGRASRLLALIRWGRKWRRMPGWVDQHSGGLLAGGVAVVALLPLVPAWPYPATRVSVPPYFTSPAMRAIPAGSVVLTYPYPSYAVDGALPMLWQAEAGFRFSMPGGYLLVPSPTGGGTATRIPALTATVFDSLYRGSPVARTTSLRENLRREWSSWRVGTLVAQPTGRDPAAAIGFLTWVAGAPPRSTGGVDVWGSLSLPGRDT